jgi:hypothetical protein
MVEKRNAYRILVGKPEGKRPLGRPRRRWVDSIKMDLKRDRMRFSEILSFRTISIVLVIKNKPRETRRFGNWICFRPQVREKSYSVGSLRKSYQDDGYSPKTQYF